MTTLDPVLVVVLLQAGVAAPSRLPSSMALRSMLQQERLGWALGAAPVPAPTPCRQPAEVLASRQATLQKVAAAQLGARREDTQTRACLAARELQRSWAAPWRPSTPRASSGPPRGIGCGTMAVCLPAGSSRHQVGGAACARPHGRASPPRVPLPTIASVPRSHRNATQPSEKKTTKCLAAVTAAAAAAAAAAPSGAEVPPGQPAWKRAMEAGAAAGADGAHLRCGGGRRGTGWQASLGRGGLL